MKNIFSSAVRCNRDSFAANQFVFGYIPRIIAFCFALSVSFCFAGCEKEQVNPANGHNHSANEQSHVKDGESEKTSGSILSQYDDLSWQTWWELSQARAATAKYKNFDNAIKDKYEDIGVVVPEMGYHFRKLSIVDSKFDFRNPEILVYNKEQDGSMRLVAVEYAIPIDFTPNESPAGFTGDDDVWDKNATFGLYLLHAWVWSFNPAGVFNPTNPLVHVH